MKKSDKKTETTLLREHAEQQFAEELSELAKVDERQRPPNWCLSPWAVAVYVLGGKLGNGFEVSPKYIGQRRLVEIAIATLATDRALLLLGVPGTAKTWLGEHLAAAVSGDSTLLVQGTAGIAEEAIRYGWNYASLLAKGFNVIATANNRDRGVNELSSALKRRFNTVILPVPETADEEVEIVRRRVESLGRALELPAEPPALGEIRRIVTIFRELRDGKTQDGKTKLKSPSGALSTAEAISVVNSGLALAAHFGDGQLRSNDVASGLVGAVVKERDGWKDLYRACREVS